MSSTTVKRSWLAGLFLRLLGYGYRAVEQTDDGFTFLGKDGRCLMFPELAESPGKTKVLGFQAVSFPLKDGTDIKLVGLKGDQVAQLVASAEAALRRYCGTIIDESGDELRYLANVVTRLENPGRYPSACLLDPFLKRASALFAKLPDSIPDDVLDDDRKRFLDLVHGFTCAPDQARNTAIDRFIERELYAMKGFFDTIESNPLTPEQRLAVVTDEDASLILAGAGSGKTSVIVTKAAYLIERGMRGPDEILLLAFGKAAAAEMAARIRERAGVDVDALTFHALGYEIIGTVEGGKPALAAHASDDVQFRALLRDILLNDLRQLSGLGGLLLTWFSEFYCPFKSTWDFKSMSEYYRYVKSHDLRTLGGERVRSFEELMIANWLYRNGIAYEYEPTYEHKLPPDSNRRAYQPDFRLSESGVYIEHFGVRKAKGPQGETRLVTAPHVDRKRYLDDMEWKRKVHRENGTVLIETFSQDRNEGRLTEVLAEKIAPYVSPRPRPQDQIFDILTELGQVDAFTHTLATFLRQFKSAGMTIERCKARSDRSPDEPRSKVFLKIFKSLIETYQKRLDDQIDFEDMIIRAAEHVEAGRYKSPYRHILVDEFQDISAGRARLLRALKAQYNDARLFAVGDDWQSIYRFTGSDVHLMQDFGQAFGGTFANREGVHRTVDLGRTFRSVDKIARSARRFVLQNSSQIDKKVVAAAATDDSAIRVRHYERRGHDAALRETLDELAQAAVKQTSVLLLGRYHSLKPKSLIALNRNYPNLDVRFMTVHASKGLEADHVIILRAETGRMGFPCEIADDPLLDLVLPKPEKFKHAEERRLFYVALTRARHSVTILVNREKPSLFARELVEDPVYEIHRTGTSAIMEHRCGQCGGRMLAQITGKKDRTYYACEHGWFCGETRNSCDACGQDLPEKDSAKPEQFTCSCGATFPVCPACGDGWLVEREGRYGTFLGCIRYPNCTGKRQLPKSRKKNSR